MESYKGKNKGYYYILYWILIKQRCKRWIWIKVLVVVSWEQIKIVIIIYINHQILNFFQQEKLLPAIITNLLLISRLGKIQIITIINHIWFHNGMWLILADVLLYYMSIHFVSRTKLISLFDNCLQWLARRNHIFAFQCFIFGQKVFSSKLHVNLFFLLLLMTYIYTIIY